jgi:hypothetical protein
MFNQLRRETCACFSWLDYYFSFPRRDDAPSHLTRSDISTLPNCFSGYVNMGLSGAPFFMVNPQRILSR